ncbi:MAG: hypothetical protein NTW16_10260 [Bacteroidetes bacterium]|nr:hypothetical protein [Bacteroidota bacterium]
MKKIILVVLVIALFGLFSHISAYSKGPLDPVRLNTWIVNASVGPGTPYFGNGAGFGPAIKGSFEKGMWDLGPGVITLGGEATFSFFSHHYGSGWNESWANFIFGGRAAYHYGWDVEGLDTYGGIPLGIGFCAHGWDNHPGSSGYSPLYPYAGFFLGASYFFTKVIGIYGEVGYNSTFANIGVVYKLK